MIQTNTRHVHQAILNELLKRGSQAIVLLDTEAKIVFCSQSIMSITGYEPTELIGRSAFDFFHPPDLPAAKQHHQYVTDVNENSFAAVIQIRNKQEDMIWIDAVVNNLLHVPEINALFVVLKNSSNAGAEERKLVEAVAEAKEQERQFLASELHDNINQIITATKLLVDTARFNPGKEQLLRLSSENLQLVADEIRKLSYSMVTYDLQEFGLAFAVKSFLATISKASVVRFRIRSEESAMKMITAQQQLQVYRIIQEATNNIIRHAEASSAEITLRVRENLIYLVINDNGKGFSMNRFKPGMGLSSISNRIKVLQGHFHVRAPKGTGTTIEIHFPVISS